MPARRREPTEVIFLRVPVSLYNELRVLLCDPRTGAPRYGKWGLALEGALREWVEKKKVARNPDVETSL